MAGTNHSDVQQYGLLQRQYSNDVIYMENFKNKLFNFLEKDPSVNFDGENFFTPLSMVINPSYGARPDGKPLPQAGKSKGVYAQYSSKNMYSSLESTMKAATRGYRGGRPDGEWLDKLVRDTMMNIEREVSNDCYQNGRGMRAFIGAGVSAAASSFPVQSSTQLLPGAKLDWYNAALTTKRGTIQIADAGIDRQARTVYIDSTYGTGQVPAGATAGDRLVVEDALLDEPTDGNFMGGLSRICDNSVSLGGVAPTSWRSWQAYNEAVANTIVSVDVVQRLMDNTSTISGKKMNRWVLNPAQKRQWFKILIAQLSYANGSLEAGASKVGYTPYKFGNTQSDDYDYGQLQILEDAACPLDTFYFWNNEAIKIAEDFTTGGPQIADNDGLTFRMQPGYDSLSAFMRYWAQIVVYQRNAVASISGLAIPQGVI